MASEASLALFPNIAKRYKGCMAKLPVWKHSALVKKAVDWLKHRYGCGVILSEQYCATGEIPDAIGWKGFCHSVVVECKASRGDFLADAGKSFRVKPEEGLGAERYYFAPAGLITVSELPKGWGLVECSRTEVRLARKASRIDQRTIVGVMKEMNLLLASLRRVEVRIEPQSITEFLKWKNRMIDYNGGVLPKGMVAEEHEINPHLSIAE